jgi:hypothetical protein
LLSDVSTGIEILAEGAVEKWQKTAEEIKK